MAHRSYQVTGIVLKRVNYGEKDRLVTLYSLERGKLTVLAKGARRLTSSRRSVLEPATQGQYFFVTGRTFNLLTQAQLGKSFYRAKANLTRIAQTWQVLEIIDHLTVENEPNVTVYSLLYESLCLLVSDGLKKDRLLNNIHKLLRTLGFAAAEPMTAFALKALIEDLSQKKLKTKSFLSLTLP